MTAKKTAAKSVVPSKGSTKPAPAAKTAAKKTATKSPVEKEKPAGKAVPVKPASKAAAKTADAVKPKQAGKGGNGKSGPASKKENVRDDDYVDHDAETESDTDVAEGNDAKAKAKPLRMKVSRAKERALMREFGLDETQLTEEEVAKRRHELKTLIKMGKTRGFLTHQEINDHLPEKLVDNEILEAIVSDRKSVV